MYDAIWTYAMPYAFGVAAVLLGQLIIAKTINTLRKKLDLEEKWLTNSAILGLIEGFLYLAALVVWKPEFIAVWLGLKTVIRWYHWERIVSVKRGDKEVTVFGRDLYNIFLIGNALVIVFAATGWKLIQHASKDEWAQVIAIAVAMTLASFALIFLAHRSRVEKAEPFDSRGDVGPG